MVPVNMHNTSMALEMHRRQRTTRLHADGAFFFALRGGRLAVRTPGVHPGNVSSNLAPRAIKSGTVIVGAMPAPSHPPRDWAPEFPTVSNIAISDRFCTALSPNVTDWARHARTSPRQAD